MGCFRVKLSPMERIRNTSQVRYLLSLTLCGLPAFYLCLNYFCTYDILTYFLYFNELAVLASATRWHCLNFHKVTGACLRHSIPRVDTGLQGVYRNTQTFERTRLNVHFSTCYLFC